MNSSKILSAVRAVRHGLIIYLVVPDWAHFETWLNLVADCAVIEKVDLRVSYNGTREIMLEPLSEV